MDTCRYIMPLLAVYGTHRNRYQGTGTQFQMKQYVVKFEFRSTAEVDTKWLVPASLASMHALTRHYRYLPVNSLSYKLAHQQVVNIVHYIHLGGGGRNKFVMNTHGICCSIEMKQFIFSHLNFKVH